MMVSHIEKKLCKFYDVLALNNLLSVKITSDTLIRKGLAGREKIIYRRATTYTDKSMKSIAAQLTIFKQQLLITVNYIESVAKDSEGGLEEGIMDMSN